MSRGLSRRARAAGRLFTLAGRRAWVQWFTVALIATAAVSAIAWRGPWLAADAVLHDAIVRATTPGSAPEAPVLVVAIDDRSLAELGRWPWPREAHARVIDALAAGGARAIGYDVLFLEAAPGDDALAASVRRAGNVWFPFLVEVPGDDGHPTRTTWPVPPLREAAAGLGHVIQRPDRDGVLRTISVYSNGRRAWPYMIDLLAARRALPAPPDGSPLIEGGASLIPFLAAPGGLATVSAADVAAGRVPAELIRGRTALVGATAAGLGDRFATPLSAERTTMPGVEVQANWLAARLEGRRVAIAGPWARLAASLSPLWIMLAGFVFLPPRWNAVLGAALIGSVLAGTALALAWGGLWIPPAATVLALALVWPIWAWRRLDAASGYMVEELAALEAEPRPMPAARPRPAGGDAVERQIALMQAAVADVRDLKRFVEQSLEGLPDATLVTSLDGRIVVANACADRLFERHGAAVREGSALAEAFAGLSVEPAAASALLAAVRSGSEPAPRETSLPDGTVLDIRIGPFTDAQRRRIGWIARLADITALRASERQREDALRLLTHDMRAPQASILAVLDRSDGVPAELAERLRRYARQTLDLADGFVNLARAESAALAREPVDLGDVAVEAADDLWPLASAKNIVVEAEGADVMVLGDRPLLTRMTANLVSNAIKYSDAGTTVRCHAAMEGGCAVLVVSDEGRGIPAEALASLFDAFTRADERSGEIGAGLGLAFVRRVAERHGGTVSAESEPGRGSVFTVRLPAQR